MLVAVREEVNKYNFRWQAGWWWIAREYNSGNTKNEFHCLIFLFPFLLRGCSALLNEKSTRQVNKYVYSQLSLMSCCYASHGDVFICKGEPNRVARRGYTCVYR